MRWFAPSGAATPLSVDAGQERVFVLVCAALALSQAFDLVTACPALQAALIAPGTHGGTAALNVMTTAQAPPFTVKTALLGFSDPVQSDSQTVSEGGV